MGTRDDARDPGRRAGGSLRAVLALAAVAVLAPVAAALAAAGDLDDTFSNDGKRAFGFGDGFTYASGEAVALDGNAIVIAGVAIGATPSEFAVARLRADGSFDPSLSGDGKRHVSFPGAGASASAVAVQPNGRILVAGATINPDSDFVIARLTSDGDLDDSFSGDGKATFSFAPGGAAEVISGIAVQADGKIVVAGIVAGTDFGVMRLNSNGTPDDSFSDDGRRRLELSSGVDSAADVDLTANGRIVVVGTSGGPPNSEIAVVRFRPGGGLDDDFSGDGMRLVSMGTGFDSGAAAALRPDGTIVVAGSSQQGSGNDLAFAQLTPSGDLDQAFSGDGKRLVSVTPGDDPEQWLAVELQGTKLVAAGSTSFGTPSDVAVVRLTEGGQLDTSFSGDGKKLTDFFGAEDRGAGVAIQADGRIVVAGRAVDAGVYRFAVARYLP